MINWEKECKDMVALTGHVRFDVSAQLLVVALRLIEQNRDLTTTGNTQTNPNSWFGRTEQESDNHKQHSN